MMRFINCIKTFLYYTKLWGILLTILSVLKSLLTVTRLLVLQNMVSVITSMRNVGTSNKEQVIYSVIMFISTYVIDSFLEYICVLLNTKCEHVLTLGLYENLYRKFKNIDYQFYENEEIYNNISRMGDDVAADMKAAYLVCLNSLTSFISIISLIVIFAQISIAISCGLVLVIFAASFFSSRGINLLNDLKYKQSKNERTLSYYMDLLTNKDSLLELILFRAREMIIKRRISEENTVIKEQFLKSIKAAFIYNISTILLVIWILSTLFYSGFQLLRGSIDIALFVVLVQTSLTLLSDMENLSYQIAEATQSVDIYKYYHNFMSLPEKVSPKVSKTLPSHICIRFSHVSFSYPGFKTPVLKDLNMELDIAKNYAIVGENGSGKSTIVKLIFGLFQPCEGDIEVSKENISVVYQDYMKYSTSIRENVVAGNDSLLKNDKEVVEIMQEAQIDDIAYQYGGLDKKLGHLYEESIDLSGGQWQRLAIARGLASKKQFIILDEPTAAMDPIAESQMYESFLRARSQRGSLIISHRLASAKLADHIFVIKDNTICEQGNHDELMQLNGYYSDLFKRQSEWYQSDEGAK